MYVFDFVFDGRIIALLVDNIFKIMVAKFFRSVAVLAIIFGSFAIAYDIIFYFRYPGEAGGFVTMVFGIPVVAASSMVFNISNYIIKKRENAYTEIK